METSSYFRLCVYFCLMMIIFTLCISFVSALQLFTPVESGVNVTLTDDPTDVFQQIVNFMFMGNSGIAGIWTVITGGLLFGSLFVAKLTGSTSVIGIWLYSAIFWTSFMTCMSVTHIESLIPLSFLAIFIVALFFVWMASLISMFTAVG